MYRVSQKNVLTVKRFCENWKTLEEQGRVPSTIYISDKWNVWIKFWARDFCWSFSKLETLRLFFQPTNHQALKVHFLFESAHSTRKHFLIIVAANFCNTQAYIIFIYFLQMYKMFCINNSRGVYRLRGENGAHIIFTMLSLI